MKEFNGKDSRAKFVYSTPVVKSSKMVYTDANGSVRAINRTMNAKPTYMPRYTVCSILDDETRTLRFGVARCSSKDSFSKEVGRNLSYERALNNPVCEIHVPESLKISDVTVDVAYRLMERYEKERTLKF